MIGQPPITLEMGPCILVTDLVTLLIDGGTTHTRFTLIRNGEIIERSRKKVGAADGGEAVRKAVGEAVRELGRKHRISAAVASGMITSAGGIKEIPHIDAPSTFEELVKNTRPHRIDSVSTEVVFYLVPGVRTQSAGGNLAETDVMRGEETEVFAAIDPEDADRSILLIHAGSHIKGILVQNKAIVRSITTLSGELFWAACGHTILKNDLNRNQDAALDERFVREGFLACRREGFTRSLFMIRLMGLRGEGAEAQVSFLYGALVCSDLTAFEPMLAEEVDKLVLYGREPYTGAMRICLETFYDRCDGLSVIGYRESEELSVKALMKIAERLRIGRVGVAK